MARQLNGLACTTLGGALGQELIALDVFTVVGANQVGGDGNGQTATTVDDCNDDITGGLVLHVPGCSVADGCDANSDYTFTDWRDVLAMIYGGQNHNTSQAQLISGARNPQRVNCRNPVRRALVDAWGNLFSTGTGGQACRSQSCSKLRHAFRLDDDSPAAEDFVGLIGMVSVPPFTTAFDPSPTFLPKPDASATANPFCNAGEAKMNKGDADYLDLDPIRRAVDQTPGTRIALEQVGEGSLPQFGGNNNDDNCLDGDSTQPGIQPQVPPTNSSTSSVPNLGPSQVIPNSVALLRDELGFTDPIGPQVGAAITKPNTRVCLGLVLPIVIPPNYTTQDAYFGASADGLTPPVPCSIDPVTGTPVMVSKILDTIFTQTLCPDGKPQPCRVPIDNSGPTPNFNCYVANLNPAVLPVRDNRVFNLHPLTASGTFKRDGYINPSIPVSGGISAARQNRVVTAFYRLHFNLVTNLNGSVATLPAGQFCRKLSSTSQIGCLVKANACSIGIAKIDSLDVGASGPQNMAFRLRDRDPSDANLANLYTTPSPADDYPAARGLFVNSVKGFANVTGDELTLLNVFRSPAIDQIVVNRGLVKVPDGITRSTGCPRP
jgi:hypothetical protein